MKQLFNEKNTQMAKKHIKIYLTSLATREMQIKMRCHHMAIRMANINTSDNNKMLSRLPRYQISHTFWQEYKTVYHFVK